MQLYATIKIGNTEYRVSPGGSVKVDRLDAEPGATIEFDSVSKLVNGDQVAEGNPLVAGAWVRARVKKHGQDNGIIVFRMGRRQLYKKKHDRQWQYTVLRIDEIVFEDRIFGKRDTDRRKIKKAQAAVEAKQPRMPIAPTPKPQPVPESVVPESVVVETASPPHTPRAVGKSNNRWMGLAALLALIVLGLLFWNRTPVPPVTAKTETSPANAEFQMLNTRKIDRPTDPAQPPD